MLIILVGTAMLVAVAVWKRGANGTRIFGAFMGFSIVIAGVISALASPGLSGGPAQASAAPTLQVAVSGTTGVRYSGTWALSTLGGSSESANVHGTTPSRFSISQQGTFGVSLHKLSASGTLIVTILVNGKAVTRRQTSAKFGQVNASYTTDGL